MPDYPRALRDYAKELSANLARRDSTEHTHRPALKKAIEALFPKTVATNEPRRIQAGAPDYIVATGVVNVGYIEAKDIGKNLREIEKDEQLKRYRASLPNLILTDYVEFRWYTDGQFREAATLGMLTEDAVKPSKESLEQVYNLLDRFMQHRVPSVGTAKDLASRMAHLARMIRNVTEETFKLEEQTGTLHAQYESFKQVLLPTLKTDEFADMFAQTVAYGLFAARVNAEPDREFTRQNAAYMLPKTNPFLRSTFAHIAGVELDDRVTWIVDDLAQVLADADMHAILEDFGTRTRREDPVVHFYETFLAEYNPKQRELRGVYYTPEPVVSYIVRSVDHLLQTKFDKPLGLADPEVMILDPACGTGTFLFEVVKLIHQRLAENGQLGSWNSYVEEKLLPRLFGFELLMAPYTIAHLKMGMLLEELGYEFKSDQRLGIYLTNTLEPGTKEQVPLGFAGFITEEANAAADVKQTKPIMVVLGNPPYSGHSANKGAWIEGLLKGRLPDGAKVSGYYEVDGKPLGEKNPKWLQDDYVKFIRFGQWRIDETGYGILAYVSNHGYLDNPTFRGMRQSLMRTFSEISILDLHGNCKKKEKAPDGGPDENVFDIQQGVAIGMFVKEKDTSGAGTVRHAHLWGSRKTKYSDLCESDVAKTEWKDAAPDSPFYLFVAGDAGLRAEYNRGWVVTAAVPVNVLGFQTHRDGFAIAFDAHEIAQRITTLLDQNVAESDVRVKYDVGGLDIPTARRKLLAVKDPRAAQARCLYRPFDERACYYSDVIMDRPRRELLDHVAVKQNLCLNIVRQTKMETWRHAVVSDAPTPALYVELKDGSNVFPLYLYPRLADAQDQQDLLLDTEPWPLSEKGRRPNLNPDFVADLKKRLGMEFVTDGKGDLEATFGPEDIFDYIYAVFHSPTYRTRYAEFLKIDFPRVPLTSDKGLFRRLAEKGAELVGLHLMESPALNNLVTSYPVAGTDEVEKVRYAEPLTPDPSPSGGEGSAGRVYINGDQYFAGVEPQVWEFHIGGYQVLDKWLKDRRGRKLNFDDQQHYQRIVVALKETMRLMGEIDSLIPSWPIE
ncbi:MAG: N-6 DNA methylase [Armatimonadetes bacterium]|nr:N-6 DNA methylase [Armatimonadota bacterium]